MTAEAPEVTDIYDIAALLENCLGDLEFAEELLDRFQAQLKEIGPALEASLNDGDLQGASRQAHSFKGAAGVLGAHRVRAAAEELELSLKTPEPANIHESLLRLQNLADQCINAHPAVRSALTKIQPAHR